LTPCVETYVSSNAKHETRFTTLARNRNRLGATSAS
jgi:hypothetical protein